MFDDMIADIESKNKLSPKVTESFLKSLKCHSLFLYHNRIYTIRPNATHNFIIKILNKK